MKMKKKKIKVPEKTLEVLRKARRPEFSEEEINKFERGVKIKNDK